MKDTYTREEVSSVEDLAYENGVAVGWLQERNRIIALLEAKERNTDYRGNGPMFSMYDIIEAIKGE